VTHTAERKPKAHQLPLRVVDCPSCGWRHLPKPEQNGGPAVEWRTPSTYSACGRNLSSGRTRRKKRESLDGVVEPLASPRGVPPPSPEEPAPTLRCSTAISRGARSVPVARRGTGRNRLEGPPTRTRREARAAAHAGIRHRELVQTRSPHLAVETVENLVSATADVGLERPNRADRLTLGCAGRCGITRTGDAEKIFGKSANFARGT
jgi:hypothetical protein